MVEIILIPTLIFGLIIITMICQGLYKDFKVQGIKSDIERLKLIKQVEELNGK